MAKSFELLLGKVFKEIMKASDDFLTALDAKVEKKRDSSPSTLTTNVPTVVTQIYQVLYQSLLYIDIFGNLLDYLCFDSYKFETIIENFAYQKSLLKIIMSLLMDFTKIKALQDGVQKRLKIRKST